MRAGSGARRLRTSGGTGVGSPAGCQLASPGRISVAIWPGWLDAACTAAVASHAIDRALSTRRTQCDRGLANPSISDVSGGSYCRCLLECSPTTLTMPDEARLALWILARPLARPGPRWSRVEAGRSVIRYQPSAAPVAMPSNRHSTDFIAGLSSAARKCISDVPGLAKQMSTPSPVSVDTSV